MEWVANCKMKKLLDSIAEEGEAEKLEMDVCHLRKLFSPPFQKVRDCILISDKNRDILEDHFDTALGMYMDKTGYEASSSETRINCFFKNKLSMKTGTKIALLVIHLWSAQLKILDPDSVFCFILSSNTERVEVRFHKKRDNESSWLNEDIESYKGAMGYTYI